MASTSDFAQAVVDRLGQKPSKLKPVFFEVGAITIKEEEPIRKSQAQKVLVGVDIFLDWKGNDPLELGNKLKISSLQSLQLKMITNRGVKVYPNGNPETYCTDHWRCRFFSSNIDLSENPNYEKIESKTIIDLMSDLVSGGYDVIKTENLYYFGNERGFTLGQGE
jgi:isocitrate dehydrogenase